MSNHQAPSADQIGQLPNTIAIERLYGALKKNPQLMQRFYDIMGNETHRPYFFPSDGTLSGKGLTPVGLAEYMLDRYQENPEKYSNFIACINWDPNCTPEFDRPFLHNLNSAITKMDDRGSFVIYRGNHTVSLMNEGNTFLLLDSYNAYGAKDADNLPLLRFIRQNFPYAQIHTLHDKIQNDYHNCSFFAVHCAGAIEKALQNENKTLAQFIQSLDTNKVHRPDPNNPEDALKVSEYRRLGINTIPVPSEIVPYVQSLSLVEKITEGSASYRQQKPWVTHQSYQSQLDNHVTHLPVGEERKLRRINNHIAMKNAHFINRHEEGLTPTTSLTAVEQ
jgi:hypothetical protein